MEDIVRITDLPGANPLDGVELVPVVQNGATKVRSVQDLVTEGGLGDHLGGADPHAQYAFRVKNNLEATTSPTANDDVNAGYEPTSRWVNTTTEEFFICVTNTAGNANWQTLTLSLDELGSAALADVGSGNGLDSDLLDGQQGTFYLDFPNFTNLPDPTLTLIGDVSGSATFNNLGNASLNVTVSDDSHNHVISNVDGLQTALDGKLPVGGKAADSELLDGINSAQFLRSDVSDVFNGDLTIRDSLLIGTSGVGRIANNLDGIELHGGTSSMFLGVQDGTGRIQWKWNATKGTDETYLVSSEPAGCYEILDVTDSANALWKIKYAPGGSAGATIPWDDILSVGTTNFSYQGNTVFTDGYHPNADQLTTGRDITLSGDVSGSANFNGTSDITINAIVADDSHNHVISNVDGLQSTLDSKFDKSGGTINGDTTVSGGNGPVTFTVIADADNSTETDTARIVLSQDGNIVTGEWGFDSNNTMYYEAYAGIDLRPAAGDAGVASVGGNQIYTTVFHPEADTLTTPRNIALGGDLSGSANFDGSSNITITATVADDSHNHVISNVDGLQSALDGKLDNNAKAVDSDLLDGNDSLFYRNATNLNAGTISDARLPATISSDITGNANTASTLQTARTISLGGDLSGSTSFNGGANVTITATVADDSHNHIISNVDGLQTALDGKLDNGAKAVDSELLDGINSTQFVRSDVDDTISANLTINNGTNTNLSVLANDSGVAEVGAFGSTTQSTGVVYAGQSSDHGGGIFYNGDGTPSYATGEASDRVSLFRRTAGVNHVVMDYSHDSNNVSFKGVISGNGSGLTSVDASTLNGFSSTSNSTTNTVVRRDGSGDINARLFRSEYDVTNPDINFIMTQIDTASDNFIRPSTPAQFRSSVTDGVYLPINGKADDSDLLDGNDSTFYQNASNLNAGTISDARLPASISSDITGNANTASTLATARTISLGGDLSGSTSFNGGSNVTITATVADDSHNHVISNVDGLQGALDSKLNLSGGTMTGSLTLNADPSTNLQAATKQYVDNTAAAAGAFPVGGIILWSGSIANIPSGYVLCDGLNGTPDLRNRFVVGAGDTYAVDATGGSADAVVVSHNHTASTNSTGSHSHSGTANSAGNHNHSLGWNQSGSGMSHYSTTRAAAGNNVSNNATVSTVINNAGSHTHSLSINSAGSHSHTVTVDTAGESGTNKNLPPYYALAYIMKT